MSIVDGRYRAFVKAIPTCQRCRSLPASDFAHPPRTSTWGGGMAEKASDYGGLHLCRYCHRLETHAFETAWPDPAKRDHVALRNLIAYADLYHPNRDLLSEVLRHAQDLLIEMAVDEGRGEEWVMKAFEVARSRSTSLDALRSRLVERKEA